MVVHTHTDTQSEGGRDGDSHSLDVMRQILLGSDSGGSHIKMPIFEVIAEKIRVY